MAIQLTAEHARQSLNEHVAARGAELHAKYGPRIGWQELQQMLVDRTCVRYPCEITFDAGPLQPGELLAGTSDKRYATAWAMATATEFRAAA